MRRSAGSTGRMMLAGMWLGALVMPFGASVAVGQDAAAQDTSRNGAVEPPRPHPGDVMRHWPAYPEDALAAGWEGTVVVRLRVTKTGEPEDISVQRSSTFTSLDVAAIAAVSRWRFEPGKRGGVAEDMTVSLPIRFTLPAETASPPN